MKLLLRFYLLLLAVLTGSVTVYAQTEYDRQMLFFENFDENVAGIPLNQGGPAPQRGTNEWTIAKGYRGLGFPATPSQTSTVGGTLNNPGGFFLRVNNRQFRPQDSAGTNFRENVASDAFTVIGSFCTMDFDKIELSYFWVGGGNDNSYAQFYANIEGAGWKPLRSKNNDRDRLKSSAAWLYEFYEEEEMGNKTNVQIGFRWVNSAGQDTLRMGFGVDDIFIVGLRDRSRLPAKLTLSNPSGRVFCKGGGAGLSFLLTHSVRLCEGDYEAQLSNQAGSFNTFTPLDIANPFPATLGVEQTGGPVRISLSSFACGIPEDTTYYVRIIRRSKYLPNVIISDSIGPFTIRQCMNQAFNINMITAINDDTIPNRSVCAGSYFIVTHNSTFCYKGTNNYVLELSDENGNFDDTTGGNYRFLGQVLSEDPDARAYPAIPPNSFSPIMPYRDRRDSEGNLIQWRPKPGCKYRLRIRVTDGFMPDSMNELNRKYFNPRGQFVSAPWGPLCVKDCAIETNETNPISVCIDSTLKDTLIIKVPFSAFRFFKNVRYGDLNKFQFQVFNYQVSTTTPIHTGKFGDPRIFPDSEVILRGHEPNDYSGPFPDTLVFKIPKPELDSLIKWGTPPGGYFMRIIATDSELNGGTGRFTDFQGTLIPLSIGVPAATRLALEFTEPGKIFCSREDFLVGILIKNVTIARQSTARFYFLPSDTALTVADIESLKDTIDFYKRGGQAVPFSRLPTVGPTTKLINWIIPGASNPNAQYYYFFAAEQSGGDTCRNKVSDPIFIQIRLEPPVEINGIPNSPCANKDIKLVVKFNENTYYKWVLYDSLNVIRDTNNIANNELKLRFSKAGRYRLGLETINKCGNNDTNFTLFAFPQPQLDSTAHFYGCMNDRVTVRAKLDSASFDFDRSLGLWAVTYQFLDEKDSILKTGSYSSNFGQTLELERAVLKSEKIKVRVSSLFSIAELQENEKDQADPCTDIREIPITLLEVKGEAKESYTICQGNNTTLQASGGDRYIWDENPTLSDVTISNPIAQPTETTKYRVRILKSFEEINNRSCEDVKEVEVRVLKAVTDTLRATFCEGKSYTLDAGETGVNYQWFDVTRGRSLGKAKVQNIRSEGVYKVTISNSDKGNECNYDIFFKATTIKSTTENYEANDCVGSQFKLKASDCISCRFKWNNGDTTRILTATDEGEYTVTITTFDPETKEDFCDITAKYNVRFGPECLKFRYLLEIPNAVSPNQDDAKTNEKWVVWTRTMKSYKARIFDRWGHEVFFAEHTAENMPMEVDPNSGVAHRCIVWDTTFNGKPVTEGAYVYVIEAMTVTDRKLHFTGNITVIR